MNPNLKRTLMILLLMGAMLLVAAVHRRNKARPALEEGEVREDPAPEIVTVQPEKAVAELRPVIARAGRNARDLRRDPGKGVQYAASNEAGTASARPVSATPAPTPVAAAPAAPTASAFAPAPGRVALEVSYPPPMFVGTPAELPPTIEKVMSRPLLHVAPGVRLLSRGLPVTASDREPIIGSLELITDGDKSGTDGSFVELAPGPQWVQLDLGAVREVHLVLLWHYHAQGRVYRDVIVQSAEDPDFVTGVRTLFNNDTDNTAGRGVGKDREYLETNLGKLFDFSTVDDGRPLRTRYLRFISDGNTSNEMNHYIEVEVYGMPVR